MDFGSRNWVVRRARVEMRWNARSVIVCALLILLTLATTAWALTLGDYPLGVDDVWLALIGDPEAGFARTAVVEWRLPRALAAAVFGAALGTAGAVFQSLTRNPLASPDIIGFSTGAYTGAIIVIIVIHGTYLQLVTGAFVGGIATAAIVYALAWRRGVQGFRLIIIGIGVSAMLGAVNTWLMLNARLEVAIRAAVWGTGSLGSVGWEQALWGGACVVVLLAGLLTVGSPLRQLELGDDAARATGVRAEPVRLAAVILGVALVAVVTAAAGPITFIALAAPQVARRLARTPGVTLASAAAMGAFMLAAADVIAQHLLPVGMPVGVVTVVGGGAFLVWLIFREVRRRA